MSAEDLVEEVRRAAEATAALHERCAVLGSTWPSTVAAACAAILRRLSQAHVSVCVLAARDADARAFVNAAAGARDVVATDVARLRRADAPERTASSPRRRRGRADGGPRRAASPRRRGARRGTGRRRRRARRRGTDAGGPRRSRPGPPRDV